MHALTYSDGVVESDGDGSPIAHICNTLRRLEFGKGKSAHTGAGTHSAAENSRIRKTPHATMRGVGRCMRMD
jgi:hypothetical protein